MTWKLFFMFMCCFSVPVPFEYCTYTLSIDAMTALEPHANLIKDLFETGKVYSEISTMLHRMVIQRCSEMSVRRFCAQHDLRHKRLVRRRTGEGCGWGNILYEVSFHLSLHILYAVYLSHVVNEWLFPSQMGPSYGHKYMTGYLSSIGLRAGECRVGGIHW